jgi:hypothetical protein
MRPVGWRPGANGEFRPDGANWRSRVPKLNTTIAHLREVLGDQTYESIAREGETMNIVAMATYAYDEIDQARTELERHR